MRLVIGAIGLSLAILTFCIVLLGARDPRSPKWASDFWIGNVHSIVILVLGCGGVLSIISALPMLLDGSIGTLHITLAALILVAGAVGVKALKIDKKLEDYKTRPLFNRP